MSKIVITVGERIRKYRNKAGLSQDKLAEGRVARNIHRATGTRREECDH